ncbi:extracellular solute-binding protein [Actinomadura fulvescens]|uniref:Sugar ABC transporter substrate-binding protein n=1 Tax=Actinomadura fulvescens TaxID=46160 RepID=A0ABN3QPK2_9ACTN
MKHRTLRSAAAVAGAVTSLALLAAGCGSSGSDGSGGADSGGVTEITYWSWLTGAQELTDAFNKSQSKIKVRFEKIPSGTNGGYDKVVNAVKAGNAPDVVNLEYNALPEFASQGLIQDIGDKAGSTVTSNFPAQIQNLVTLGGKTWALPRDAAPQVFYYRKDLFAKHNLKAPKTWDDFKAAAEKVKKADKASRIAAFWADEPGLLAALAWQAGAKWYATEGDAWKVSYTDPASKKVAGYWNDLVKQDLVWNQVSYSPEWTKGMVDGKTLAVIGASWSGGALKATVPAQSGKWAAAPMPTWDGTPASGMLGGSAYALPKGGKKAEAALRFTTFATTTADSFKAQLSSGASSALPAKQDLVAAAKQFFDTEFYGGQDIYTLSSAQIATIKPGWVWGPLQISANGTLKDAMGTQDYPAALDTTQQKAVEAIKGRGLKLAG